MKFFKRIKKFIKNNKFFSIIIICIVLLFVIPVIINFLYFENWGIPIKWEASDSLLFYGSFLTFGGTTLLGIIAWGQNKLIHRNNDDWQRKFFEINQKTMELNQRLMEMEENKLTPFIIINDSNQFNLDFNSKTNRFTYFDGKNVLLYQGSINKNNGSIPERLFEIELDIMNVSEVNIKNIIVKNISIQIGSEFFGVTYSCACKRNNLLVGKEKKLLYVFQEYLNSEIKNYEELINETSNKCLPLIYIQIVFNLIDFTNQTFEEKIQISGPAIKASSLYNGVYYTNISHDIEYVCKAKK